MPILVCLWGLQHRLESLDLIEWYYRRQGAFETGREKKQRPTRAHLKGFEILFARRPKTRDHVLEVESLV